MHCYTRSCPHTKRLNPLTNIILFSLPFLFFSLSMIARSITVSMLTGLTRTHTSQQLQELDPLLDMGWVLMRNANLSLYYYATSMLTLVKPNVVYCNRFLKRCWIVCACADVFVFSCRLYTEAAIIGLRRTSGAGKYRGSQEIKHDTKPFIICSVVTRGSVRSPANILG